MLRAGELIYRVTIQSCHISAGENGNMVSLWLDDRYVHGAIRLLPVRHRDERDIGMRPTHEIKLRWLRSLTTAHRLILDGVPYVIDAIDDVSGQHIEMRCSVHMADKDDIRAIIARDGRTLVLIRMQPNQIFVSIKAVVRNYAATELIGGITQDDVSVTITNKELDSAGWNSPQKNDRLQMDGRYRAVQAVEPLYSGEQLIGYRLHAKG